MFENESKDVFYISWLSEVGDENRRQKEQINPKKDDTSSAKSTHTHKKTKPKPQKGYLSCQEYLPLKKCNRHY